MRPVFALLLLLVLAMAGGGATAQDKVHFASLDGKDGGAPTVLDGYLFRPSAPGRHPAIVFMHGCGGLISPATGAIMSREIDWERRLVDKGFVVLMVDSFTPRDTREMCSPRSFKEGVYMRRPADAYGALAYLQTLPFVRPRPHRHDGLVTGRRRRAVTRSRAAASDDRRASPNPISAPRSPSTQPRAARSDRERLDNSDSAADPDRRQGCVDTSRAVPGAGRHGGRATARRSSPCSIPAPIMISIGPVSNAASCRPIPHAQRRGADHRRGSRRPCRRAGARAGIPRPSHLELTWAPVDRINKDRTNNV